MVKGVGGDGLLPSPPERKTKMNTTQNQAPVSELQQGYLQAEKAAVLAELRAVLPYATDSAVEALLAGELPNTHGGMVYLRHVILTLQEAQRFSNLLSQTHAHRAAPAQDKFVVRRVNKDGTISKARLTPSDLRFLAFPTEEQAQVKILYLRKANPSKRYVIAKL